MELPGKLKMGVSGCANQCAETGFKDVGLVGGPSGWKLVVGGCGGGRPRIAEPVAKDLSDQDALATIDKVIDYYKANAKPRERLGRLIDRTGLDALKQAAGLAQGQ